MKRPPKSNPTNTVHFACFRCRSSFKQPESSNWDAQIPRRPFECPNCKLPMERVGRYFKAPAKRAIRQWEKVELLHSFGERFESSGTQLDVCCPTLSATQRYLIEHGHDETDVRNRLAQIRRQRQEDGTQ